jgi:hypothetical protein
MIETSLRHKLNKATLLNYTKSGKPIWFDISTTPVFDENGIYTNFINVKKDVTDILKNSNSFKH